MAILERQYLTIYRDVDGDIITSHTDYKEVPNYYWFNKEDKLVSMMEMDVSYLRNLLSYIDKKIITDKDNMNYYMSKRGELLVVMGIRGLIPGTKSHIQGKI